MDIGAKEIRQWHKERGWADIGYHYVIRRDGTVEKGRAEAKVGAHVAGHNKDSIGICLVGGIDERTLSPEDNYTPEQWEALENLLHKLVQKYPDANVIGHRDFPGVAKACPCFDAEPWAASRGFRTRGTASQSSRELKNSRTIAGASMAAVGGTGELVTDTANQLSPLAEYSDMIRILFAVLLFAGVALTIYARWTDAKRNPKFAGTAPEDDSR
jgi:N-acetylmuramoyl-L-alanine amidase